MKSEIELSYIENFSNWEPEFGPKECLGINDIRKHGKLLPKPYRGKREFRFVNLSFRVLLGALFMFVLSASMVALYLLPFNSGATMSDSDSLLMKFLLVPAALFLIPGLLFLRTGIRLLMEKKHLFLRNQSLFLHTGLVDERVPKDAKQGPYLCIPIDSILNISFRPGYKANRQSYRYAGACIKIKCKSGMYTVARVAIRRQAEEAKIANLFASTTNLPVDFYFRVDD